MSKSPIEDRKVTNEALFREVNERMEELDADLGPSRTSFQILCECSSSACTERIEIPHKEYDELRMDSTWFAVLPGHEDLTVEKVVDDRGTYLVVAKELT